MAHGSARPTTRLSLGKRLAFTAVVVLVVYAAAEAVAWHVYASNTPGPVREAVSLIRRGGDPFRFAPRPYQLYVPRPDYAAPGGDDRHNDLGFRGDATALPKPPGVFRIVCLGGSTTYSYRVNGVERTFPHQLETFLRAEAGAEGIEVVNAGCPGATSAEVLQTLAFRVPPLAPDLLIVHTGINDAILLERAGLRLDYGDARQPAVLPRYGGLTRGLLASPLYRLTFVRTRLPRLMHAGVWDAAWAGARHLHRPTAYEANTVSTFLLGRGRGIPSVLVTERGRRAGPGAGRLWGEAMDRVREAGLRAADRCGVPVCRFDRFPCTESDFVDLAHLRATAIERKAAWVGRDLLQFAVLPVGAGHGETPAGATGR